MKAHQDNRWIQRLSNYSRALTQLEAAVSLANQRPLSALEQQGMIQCFEYTHELSWNVLRDYLKDQGTQQLYGSKATVREAFSVELITDGEAWMEMIRDRNQSSYTYNITVANAIVDRVINTYVHAFKELQNTFEGLAHDNKA